MGICSLLLSANDDMRNGRKSVITHNTTIKNSKADAFRIRVVSIDLHVVKDESQSIIGAEQNCTLFDSISICHTNRSSYIKNDIKHNRQWSENAFYKFHVLNKTYKFNK